MESIMRMHVIWRGRASSIGLRDPAFRSVSLLNNGILIHYFTDSTVSYLAI